MDKKLIIEGIVIREPQRREDITEFCLQHGYGSCLVHRRDHQWQIKDLLFLCQGQQLQVTGFLEDGWITAEKIQIMDCSTRNYLKETDYGNSSIQEPDSGDSPI